MQTGPVITFTVIATMLVLGSVSILTVANTINSNNDNQFPEQVFAHHMDLINSTENTIVHQGLIASGKPPQIHTLPNESIEAVTILPFRTDGSIYKGDLTYTATKPVEITIGHRIPLNDSTLSHLETQKHGKLFVRHLTANVEGNLSAPSKIVPDYRASSSPYYSASIHFVGSQVVLRSTEPFIVGYTVAADIVKPTIIIHLENATVTNTNSVTNRWSTLSAISSNLSWALFCSFDSTALYSEEDLNWTLGSKSEKIQLEAQVVWSYFNNHYDAKAVINALEFREMLGESFGTEEQSVLEYAKIT